MGFTDSRPLEGLRVLVTDGEQRAALAIVRSLGTAGAVPFVCSASGRSLAGASRFAVSDITTLDPLERAETFAEGIHEIVGEHGIECLLPVTEASLRSVLRSVHLFEDVLLPFPSLETFTAASNKRSLLDLARSLGVPVPNQTVLYEPRAAVEDAARWRFPLVLKPAVSVASQGATSVRLSVRHVRTREQLQSALVDLPPVAFPLLVQERVRGPGVGIFLLRWDDRIIARFAHRRIREKPPSGGVSVCRESIEPPPGTMEFSEALLAALDWRGVAMVEFKLDDRSGTPYLMEVNGRFWGSLQLAIDAGVDFPRLLCEAGLGGLPPRVVEGRPGVRLRWLLGDLDHLLLRLRRSGEELALGTAAPGRLRAIGTFLVPWRPRERLEVLRPSDPRPFLRELRTWIADGLRRP